VEQRGAGGSLFTSMDNDLHWFYTSQGFTFVSDWVNIQLYQITGSDKHLADSFIDAGMVRHLASIYFTVLKLEH
jgi:hypothetical protein